MLTAIEKTRLQISKNTTAEKKAQLGQFFTPALTARYMAGLFNSTSHKICRLLDPGAGIGSLSSAFLERCIAGDLDFSKVEITAFVLDNLLHTDLAHTFASYAEQISIVYEMIDGDFIEEAVNRIQFGNNGYTHAILNPPYKKINNASRHRLLLRDAGIETVNLYSAFVALTLAMMAPGGQIVAIIPRSFCNGPYYRPFRRFLLERAAIRQIHLFKSRDQAFKDDNVLQENIIIVLERGGQQGEVKITTSTDDRFHDLAEHIHPFGRIVFADDSVVKDTFTPTKSRAEVKAEVLKARAAGVLQFVTELQSQVHSVAPATAATASALTREQVRAQLLKSPRPQAGELYPTA